MAVNKKYRGQITAAVQAVLNSGNYILGEEGRLFEREFAAYCGSKYCVAVANGTDALFLAIKALQLKKGARVIVAANSYVATALAVFNNGLIPVPVEANLQSCNIDAGKIEEKISPQTGAILVTHLYGRICQMDKVNAIAQKYSLPVIEDCAQAHGSVYRQTKAGNLGSIGAFSFYPTKNLGALGDAGAITTNSAQLAETIMHLRNYGFKETNHAVIKGHNSRMDEIQAAVLRVKLKYLDRENAVRKKIALQYLAGITNPKLILPVYDDAHAWHLFVVRNDRREKLQAYLLAHGIESKIHYPIPYYRQPAFKEFGKAVMPLSDTLHSQVLSIPLHTGLKQNEVNYIIETLNKY